MAPQQQQILTITPDLFTHHSFHSIPQSPSFAPPTASPSSALPQRFLSGAPCFAGLLVFDQKAPPSQGTFAPQQGVPTHCPRSRPWSGCLAHREHASSRHAVEPHTEPATHYLPYQPESLARAVPTTFQRAYVDVWADRADRLRGRLRAETSRAIYEHAAFSLSNCTPSSRVKANIQLHNLLPGDGLGTLVPTSTTAE